MLELRITVLRDMPNPEMLKRRTGVGYNLFHDKDTDLYFLTDGASEDFERDGFGSDYHRVFDIPTDYDWSYLKTFKANHNDLLKDTLIHDEILIDALALSEAFSTRVLCVYSNDEDCDFAVTAENGALLRLRFKVGRKRGNRVHNDVAHQIETEIRATRILTDGEEPTADEVFEYTAFEAIQTLGSPLALHSFWQYREGEIEGQVVFDTIQSTPIGTAPSLFFRNAFLEFEEAFGQIAPDFTDIPKESRFQRVAFEAPPKTTTFGTFFNLATNLLSLMASSRKAMLWTLSIIFVLLVAIFGRETERPNKHTAFKEHCAAAGGSISNEFDGKCRVNDTTYNFWNLPGETQERRIMILNIGPQKVPCTDIRRRKCLLVDGEFFYDHIEGFTFREGQQQIVPVERIQICDPDAENDCALDASVFRFRQLLDLGK